MKKESVKVAIKAANNAKREAAKRVNNDKREVKNSRKTTAGAVAFLAPDETEASANFRAFLGLKKGANKEARKQVCKWIEERYIYVCRKVYVHTAEEGDAVEVEFSGVTACNKNGRVYNDMLDAIAELRKVYESTIATRNEMARQMWLTRAKLIERGDYLERVQYVLNAGKKTPAKIGKQIRLGDVVIRK